MGKRIPSNKKKIFLIYSKRLKTEVDFLNETYGNDKDVIQLIISETKKNLSTSKFSRMQSLQKDDSYISQTMLREFPKIFTILEKVIKENYKHVWDEKTEKLKEIDIHQNIERVEALKGVYEAYSWDWSMSKINKTGFIHYFKINVIDVHNIICETQRTSFKSRKISLIGSDKISIELTTKDLQRKVYLVIHIGNLYVEDLKKEKTFYLAYTDTGNTKVKCGLAILERSGEEYDKIETGRKPISDYMDIKDQSFFTFLNDSQKVIG